MILLRQHLCLLIYPEMLLEIHANHTVKAPHNRVIARYSAGFREERLAKSERNEALQAIYHDRKANQYACENVSAVHYDINVTVGDGFANTDIA